MKITPLDLEGLILIDLDVYGDSRGFFIERFHQSRFSQHGLPTNFVQDNHSRSAPGALRGLHYDSSFKQGKLVGVSRGRIWDVAVDIRPNSSTYTKSFGTEVSDVNGRLMWIPPGFAHGFCVIGEEPADVMYKVDTFYDPANEAGIFWADSDLTISWPVSDPTLSVRDQQLQSFADYHKSLNSPSNPIHLLR
jgi:dTDP-4-dehydrorhamnose 3,5-epimerase